MEGVERNGSVPPWVVSLNSDDPNIVKRRCEDQSKRVAIKRLIRKVSPATRVGVHDSVLTVTMKYSGHPLLHKHNPFQGASKKKRSKTQTARFIKGVCEHPKIIYDNLF
jgi:hypothetical protein